jgi:DNA-binding IclR family transcriptional regulator
MAPTRRIARKPSPKIARDSDSLPPTLRSFLIAEAVAGKAQPLKLEAICDATAIPKGSAHRLVNGLVQTGFLVRDAGSKTYSVGPRLSALGLSAQLHSSMRGERHAVLKTLVDQVGETCNMTTLDGAEIVYIDRVESAWPLRLHLQAGSRVPIHCTSSGKLFLSQMRASHRKRVLNRAPLKRYTSKTITDVARLESELARIRRSRVATDDEGFLAGLISVAVPVVDRRGEMIAAVAVHAPSARLSLREGLEHVGLLRWAADELARLYE